MSRNNIPDYEGSLGGVSVPGNPVDASSYGRGISTLGQAFFRQMHNQADREDKRARALSTEAGVQAGAAGKYKLADPSTIMGEAFNNAARDTYAKQVESTARQKIDALSQEHAADPVALQTSLESWRDGFQGDLEEQDPLIAAGFKNAYGILASNAIDNAKNNARNVALDANRAATMQASQQRFQSYSQSMKKAGTGDLAAQQTATLERDLMLSELLASGPAAPFEYDGKVYPAGTGAFQVQEIQKQMALLDAEGDEQAIMGWWGNGPMSAGRADAWYKNEVPGITQDRKDALYGQMLGDVKEADYRQSKAEAQAEKAARIVNASKKSDLEIALARGEKGYGDVEQAFHSGVIDAEDRTRYTIGLDKRGLELDKARKAGAFLDAVAAGNAVVDPKNSQQRDMVNEDFREKAAAFMSGGGDQDFRSGNEQPKTDADLAGFIVDYSLKMGMIPDDVKSNLRGQLISGSPDQRIAASDQIEKLRQANPSLVQASFDQSDIEAATMIADQARAGVPVETAVKNVDDRLRVDSATRDARKEGFNQAFKPSPNQTQLQAGKSDLAGQINSNSERWLGWLPLVGDNPDVPDVMASEYMKLTEDAYIRTGDMATARKTATDNLQSVWGVSSINGKRAWMKFAPENYYGAPAGYGLSATENSAWMKDQLVGDFTDNALIDISAGKAADRLSIVPDPLGRKKEGKPVFQVMFQDSSGKWTPVLDQKGNVMAWRPDWDRSAKKSELDLARTQRMFNSQQDRRQGAMVAGMGAYPTLSKLDDGTVGYLSDPKSGKFVTVDGNGTKTGSLTVKDGAPASASAFKALKPNPQETYLYQHHLRNLETGKAVTNPDGSTSTIFNITVERGGKTYVIPTIWDGKAVSPQEAQARAGAAGWDKWPSYGSEGEAEARYNKLHDAMAVDVVQ